jgi:RNA polymerase sigma-70 factor (ECF subfamily)
MSVKNPASLAETVFDRYRRNLQRFLIQRLRGSQDASDLSQEVYLRLLRVPDLSLVRQPRAYLFRIAANVVYEFHIGRQQESVTFDSEILDAVTENPPEPTQDELAERLHTERQLEAVLAQLSPLYRAILLMQKRDGMSYAEIGKELRLSVHTVEKYLFRALAMVRATKWER